MSTVPTVFPGPFDWAAFWFRHYDERLEAFSRGWIEFLRRFGSRPEALSPQDIAVDRINQMQVLLYRGYVRRKKLKTLRNREREMQRFASWMHRHSGNFRRLLDVYPEWLGQFDDPTESRARLMRTIAFHLYQ